MHKYLMMIKSFVTFEKLMNRIICFTYVAFKITASPTNKTGNVLLEGLVMFVK